jgi:hypothetical protein
LAGFNLRLVVLGQPLSDVGGAQAHDRVLSSVVVGGPSEHFKSDDTFTQRAIGGGEAMLDDVAK